MKYKMLSKTIALVMGSGMLAAGSLGTASAATTMYNTFNHGVDGPPDPQKLMATIGGNVASVSNGTDGWVRAGEKTVFGAPQPIQYGDGPGGSNRQDVPWVGTPGGARPFGYTGDRHLNWAIHLESAGDSGTISSQDAFDKYGIYADIDTAGGAWLDNTPTPYQGWKHDIEIGLLKSDVTQEVTLSVQGLKDPSANYAFTVFKGMDNHAQDTYSHHGVWHENLILNLSDDPPAGYQTPNGANGPFGGDAGRIGPDDFAMVDDWTGNDATFTAEAGQIYTILLGGYKADDWTVTRQGHVLNVTTSPVPLPAAAWLFAPAIAGLLGFGRRKATNKQT